MMTDDLIERLQQGKHSYCTDVPADACNLCRERTEAAAVLEAQQAEIERLVRNAARQLSRALDDEWRRGYKLGLDEGFNQ